MHVAQLFNSLLLGVNVEIVVAALPKRSLSTLHGNRELESLQCSGESSVAWLTDQKMHVLGHDHVADNEEAIAQTDGFKRALKKLALRTKLKICQPPIAGESHEMQVTSLLIPYQSLRHKRQSYDPSHISLRYGAPKFRCRPSSRSFRGLTTPAPSDVKLVDSHISGSRCGAPGINANHTTLPTSL